MQEWLMQLWSDFSKTVLFVTHDVRGGDLCSRTRSTLMGQRTGPRNHRDDPGFRLLGPRIRGSVLAPEFLAIKERCLDLLHLDPTASEAWNEAA